MKILRNAIRTAVTALLGLLAASAQAAGFRMIEVPSDADHAAITGAMWYPCPQPPGEIDLGKFRITGTKDCPVHGDHLPLVVISHGSLGAYFDHYDTAAALADAGFVVAAISHRGDNVPTMNDAADPAVMFERPESIVRLIDFMISASPAASHIDSKRIGFFGFSAGGFTGLQLMGADPYWAVMLCRFSPDVHSCAATMGRNFRVKPHPTEPRIKAAVLADPAGLWLVPESISKVKIPIQLWASEQGGRDPKGNITLERMADLDERLTRPHEYHVVPNAWHFSFVLCGPSISSVPEFCTDAAGFDRLAFHARFNREVVRFFRANLESARKALPAVNR
jgi:predicted dienelactone hydrolase